jgi:hypothetical protein
MLCNARTDFTNASLYAEDTVFAHSFGIEARPFGGCAAATTGEIWLAQAARIVHLEKA